MEQISIAQDPDFLQRAEMAYSDWDWRFLLSNRESCPVGLNSLVLEDIRFAEPDGDRKTAKAQRA